jgi:hypothetical protein
MPLDVQLLHELESELTGQDTKGNLKERPLNEARTRV